MVEAQQTKVEQDEKIEIQRLAQRTLDKMDRLLNELEQLVDFEMPSSYLDPFNWIREQLIKIEFGVETMHYFSLLEHFNEAILYLFDYLRNQGYTISSRPRYNKNVFICAKNLGELKRDVQILSDYQFEERKKIKNGLIDDEKPLHEVKELKETVKQFKATLLFIIGFVTVSLSGGIYYAATQEKKLRKENTELKQKLTDSEKDYELYKKLWSNCATVNGTDIKSPRLESKD